MQNLLAAALLFALPLFPAALGAQQIAPEHEAVVGAAEEWLGLIDAGEFEESWARTAPLFQTQVSASQWSEMAQQVANQIGTAQNREINQVTEESSLPGAPPGEYRVLEFQSAFQAIPAAVETVILRDEGDQEWSVVGYFVRPAM